MSVNPPLLIPVNDREFVLIQTFRYLWMDDQQQCRLTILKGFNTDLASIPRFLWSLTGLVPDGTYRTAALVHDLLYQWRGLPQKPAGYIEILREGKWVEETGRLTRKQCDALFSAIMMESGTTPIKRRLMVSAVRCFGFLAWNR